MLDKMIYIDNEYKRLKKELETIDQKMITLKQQGMTTAKPYWMRRDDPTGKPDQLELTHPTDSDYYQQHRTRREYIGVDVGKIVEALARIDRWMDYRALQDERNEIRLRLEAIERQLVRLEIVTLGLHGLADKYFDGDIKAAQKHLQKNSLALQEAGASWSNGAWGKYKPLPKKG